MKLIASLACALVLLSTISCHPIKSVDDEYFVNKVVLREPNVYTLYWNFTETDTIFKAVVETTGWMGFGLSPNGGMYSSDLMMAWFSPDGTENFVDAHVRPSGLHRPIPDTNQNWKKLFMKQENGFITVIFTRKNTICGQEDSEEVNLSITETQPVIFAGGEDFDDAERSFPAYHGNVNRGSKVMSITGKLNKPVEIDLPNTEYHDFHVTTDLPNGLVTEYYCELFKIPNTWENKKRHVIRYDTIVKPENLKYVHHWLMYECQDSFASEYLPEYGWPAGASCLSGGNQWDKVQQYCKKISLAWAVGGDLEVTLPEEYGYPIGGEGEFRYFFIQMHYENPNLDEIIHDETGFRLYVTEDYRPIEFGILTVGTTSDALALWLPPKMESLTVENVCGKEFMNKLYEETGNITIFAELPHTHLAGTGLYTKVLRKNKEIEHISYNPYYDFNYQYINFKTKNIVLEKDDEIINSCVYSTKDRDSTTLGGLGTYDEMCLNFIWYYPRNTKYVACYDQTSVDEWIKLFTEFAYTIPDFKWIINSDQTFIQDTVASFEASPTLMSRHDFVQQKFQEVYSKGKKNFIQSINNGDDIYTPEVTPPEVERLVDDNCSI